ncbi:MAG: signal peptidase I [Clostridia bacterium]|nr:signal peptidase I [Clostridia bacterium]
MEQKDNKKLKETRTFWNELYEWVDCAIITIICILLMFTFVFRQVKIDGGSMEPTLRNEERVIVSDMFYTPEYGDIVVISSEVYDNVPIIKRVIATEGQWIDIYDGLVYVGDSKDDMKPVGSEFVGDIYTEAELGGGLYEGQEYPLQVPENHVFVLGDNRSVSLDSRTTVVGLIDERHILGKALYRIYPFSEFGSIY